MYYRAFGPGVLDGGANVNIANLGEVYSVDYSLSVRIGKKIFGKFIGKTLSYSGNVRVPAEMMSEKFIAENNGISFGKVSAHKVAADKFKFSAGPCEGVIYLAFDGLDPVEVRSVEILGLRLSL